MLFSAVVVSGLITTITITFSIILWYMCAPWTAAMVGSGLTIIIFTIVHYHLGAPRTVVMADISHIPTSITALS